MIKTITDLTIRKWRDILGHVQAYNALSYRRRPASEILWAMVKANGKRTN